MNMVMNVLARDDGSFGMSLMGCTFGATALKLEALLLEFCFDGFRIPVMVFTSLNPHYVMYVFFG